MNEQTVPLQTENSAVAIHLEREAFSKFILEFLGTKEKLVYERYASFRLHHNDIEQFYYLLEAKVSKEKNIVLDHFSVNVIYDDNTKRELYGIDNLKKFNETRYVNPVSITLSWNLVVGFGNANTIENQVIEVTFNTKKRRENKQQAWDEGDIKLIITSTNQAWANEVLNLFKDQINNVIIQKSAIYSCIKFISSVDVKATLILFMSLFMMLTAGLGQRSDTSTRSNLTDELSLEIGRSLLKQGDPYIEFIKFSIKELQVEQIKELSEEEEKFKSTKIFADLIKVKELRKLKDTLFELALILFVAFFVVLVLYPRYALKYYGAKSFIFLTKKAEQLEKKEKDSKNKLTFFSFTSVVITVVIAVIANWISLMIL